MHSFELCSADAEPDGPANAEAAHDALMGHACSASQNCKRQNESWGRTVALDKVKAPAIKADGAAQPLEPGLEVVPHARVGVVDVGRCHIVLARFVVAGAAEGGIVAAYGILAPG